MLGGALLICAVSVLRLQLSTCRFLLCRALERSSRRARFVHLGVLLLRCMVTSVNLEGMFRLKVDVMRCQEKGGVQSL